MVDWILSEMRMRLAEGPTAAEKKPVGKVAQTPLVESRKIWDSIRVKGTQAMATPIFTLSPEMQDSWDYVMGQMLSFVNDTNADVDMAYDFVCEQLDISSFVDNEAAWNDFYDTWEAADNRNQTQYNFA